MGREAQGCASGRRASGDGLTGLPRVRRARFTGNRRGRNPDRMRIHPGISPSSATNQTRAHVDHQTRAGADDRGPRRRREANQRGQGCAGDAGDSDGTRHDPRVSGDLSSLGIDFRAQRRSTPSRFRLDDYVAHQYTRGQRPSRKSLAPALRLEVLLEMSPILVANAHGEAPSDHSAGARTKEKGLVRRRGPT